MLHSFTGQTFLDILVHMDDGEQMYIIHVQTQRVQVQKYTARGLFSVYVQMSRVEGGRKHHRDKELVSQLCVTFYWNRKSEEVNSTKRRASAVVQQSAVTWCWG